MKKIFTLLFAVGFLTAASHAQSGSRDNQQRDQRTDQQSRQKDNQQYDPKSDQQTGQWDKNNGYSNGRDMGDNNDRYSNSFYGGSMKMQIAQINRKYDVRIERVKSDFFMRRSEKMRAIRSLENQRQQEIRMLYARSNKNRQDDRGYNSNRRY